VNVREPLGYGKRVVTDNPCGYPGPDEVMFNTKSVTSSQSCNDEPTPVASEHWRKLPSSVGGVKLPSTSDEPGK
jgi:hypothetical protein